MTAGGFTMRRTTVVTYARLTGMALLLGSAFGDALNRLRRKAPRSPEHFREDFLRLVIRPLFRPVAGRDALS